MLLLSTNIAIFDVVQKCIKDKKRIWQRSEMKANSLKILISWSLSPDLLLVCLFFIFICLFICFSCFVSYIHMFLVSFTFTGHYTLLQLNPLFLSKVKKTKKKTSIFVFLFVIIFQFFFLFICLYFWSITYMQIFQQNRVWTHYTLYWPSYVWYHFNIGSELYIAIACVTMFLWEGELNKLD